MKKIYALLLCSLLGGNILLASPSFKSLMKGNPKNTPRKAISDREKFSSRSSRAAEIWRAKTQKSFGWNGTRWELEETYKTDYDSNGLKTAQTVTDIEGFTTKETYTYNENGMLQTRFAEVAESPNGVFSNSSKLSREYDTVLTSFITVNNQELWTGEAWVPSNNYTQTITRNEQGNITAMERSVYYMGIMDPVYRLKIEYGADGKASRMEESELTYDYASEEYEWVVSTVIEDIIWEETNGQIVNISELNDLFEGDNRIKSATVTVEDMTASLNVEYEGPEYTATLAFFDEEEGMNVESSISLSYLDSATDPDSNHWTIGREYLTTTRFMMTSLPIYEENVRETYVYDNNDLIILEKVEIGNGEDWEIEDMVTGNVKYDEEKGYPLSWTVAALDYESGQVVNSFRALYSDYEDVSVAGVEEISPETGDYPAIYYNLQGMRVDKPQAGAFYIKVVNGKSTVIRL
ncbi:MAG: hypothetical protein K2N05_01090 [Muribaculaceae bacterium]|nr:hypothetical protein [Muribaculaceae bacterium]